jgi:F-box and leucine-rich repeat protein GRR1
MKLAGCHRLTDDSIISLVQSCPLILELDIASVPQLRDTSIYAMWLNSIHLRELKLGKNDNFTSGAIPDLPTLYYEPNDSLLHYSNPLWIKHLERNNHYAALLSPAISRNRAMTVDSYINIKRERESRGVVDIQMLRPLAPTFDHLRIVDLTACSEFDDQTLINLIKSAPKLRNLTLAKCVRLTDLGMEHVAKLGKQLHYLHLGHVDK